MNVIGSRSVSEVSADIYTCIHVNCTSLHPFRRPYMYMYMRADFLYCCYPHLGVHRPSECV